MNETLFYVFGLALVVSALVVSAIGLRYEGFPGTRAVLAAIIAYFVCMVAATTTFAVLQAADEQQAREAEQAHEEAARPSENATAGGESTTTTTAGSPTTGAQGGASALKLAADPNAIAYDTKELSGKSGTVTIDFTNPSPITHDVCVSSSSGQEIGCSQTITQGNTSLSEDLKAGQYTFFCSVDGHAAAGMEGTLTIK